MKIQDIKNFLENESLIKKLKLDCQRPTRQHSNKNILKQIILNNKVGIKTNNELIYLLRNKDNLENLHIFCLICGKKNRFIDNKRGYNKYCGAKCSASSNDTKLKRETTNVKLYGVKIISQLEAIKKSISYKNHIHAKEADIKRKKTNLLLYNDPNYHNIEKMRQTNLKRYGAMYNWASKDPKLNGRATREKLYGDPFYKDMNKTINTNLKRYGVKWCLQLPKVNQIRNSKEILQKMYETKKKNKSFNKRSKVEIRCFELLKTKFPDAEHSYKDKERYPFICDVYIPNKNLFIEFHFGEFHYIEPFDENNIEHMKRLEQLKEKELKILNSGKRKTKYTSMIKTWSITDPLKLATFKKNKLNYKIFYTEEEFLKWFNNLV